MKPSGKGSGVVRPDGGGDPAMCCPQKAYFRFKDTNRLKVKAWKGSIVPTANRDLEQRQQYPTEQIEDQRKCYWRQRGTYSNEQTEQEDAASVHVFAPNGRAL